MSAAFVSAFYDVGDILYQKRKAQAQAAQQQYLLSQHAQRTCSHVHAQAHTHMLSGERRILGSQAGLRMAPSPDSGHSSPILGAPRDMAYRKLDRSMSEPTPITAIPQQAGTIPISPNQLPPQNVNASRYKTEMCRPFEENGHCKYGDKCQFAHGIHELRGLSRHPKYKTELCRTFHTIGFCPYGPRCHFIHNEDLRRLSQISQAKVQQQAREVTAQHSAQPAVTPIYGMSQPTAIQRPKALSFNMTMLCDSLGSTADSPTPSLTDSPTASPTFYDDLEYGVFSPPPPQSAPARSASQQHFMFPGDQEALMASMMTPLAVNTQQQAQRISLDTQTAMLTAALQALQMQRRREMPAPPSPPDSDSGDSGVSSVESTCGSPLEVSRGLRLPIFSRLSCSD